MKAAAHPNGLIDLHSHHRRCGHARGELRDYVDGAVVAGITRFGISDHAPLFAEAEDDPQPTIRMARSEYQDYLREAKALRARHAGELAVLVGVEADYVEGEEARYREILAASELDYVIGSVHAFGPYHVYQRETWPADGDRRELFSMYFRHVRQAAMSGLFDILGHFDAVKVFGPEVFDVAQDDIAETLDAIVASGITVEINTAGLRKCGEVFPRPALIRALASRGVRFTFGSDAHAPEELGYGSTEVLALCEQFGIDTFATFASRTCSLVPRPRLPARQGAPG